MNSGVANFVINVIGSQLYNLLPKYYRARGSIAP